MNWFFIDESITDGERRQGPYSIDEIRDFVKSGKITDDTLVWHTGEEEWHTWKETAEAAEEVVRQELLQSTIEALLKEQSKKDYAGFFTRLLAYMIDYVIVTLFCAIPLVLLVLSGNLDLNAAYQWAQTWLNDPTTPGLDEALFSIRGVHIFLITTAAINAFYFIYFGAKWSSTPGKRILRLRIETPSGASITWKTAVIRYLMSILSASFYCIGYVIMIFDFQRRTLHDWVAQTRVVIVSKEDEAKQKED